MGIVIRTEINPETGQQVMDEINPKGHTYSTDELCEINGCDYIEILYINIDGVRKIMAFDEEATFKPDPQYNAAATEVLWEGNVAHRGHTPLYGTVAVIGIDELK
jgi:hypothetical protein